MMQMSQELSVCRLTLLLYFQHDQLRAIHTFHRLTDALPGFLALSIVS
jgi:hypothetical protein